MSTLIRRAEAKQIVDACDAAGWVSPYSPIHKSVPLVVLAESFLRIPACLEVLLGRHPGDDEDYLSLQALAMCRDYYWQEKACDQEVLNMSFQVLQAWVAHAETRKLIERISRPTGKGDIRA